MGSDGRTAAGRHARAAGARTDGKPPHGGETGGAMNAAVGHAGPAGVPVAHGRAVRGVPRPRGAAVSAHGAALLTPGPAHPSPIVGPEPTRNTGKADRPL